MVSSFRLKEQGRLAKEGQQLACKLSSASVQNRLAMQVKQRESHSNELQKIAEQLGLLFEFVNPTSSFFFLMVVPGPSSSTYFGTAMRGLLGVAQVAEFRRSCGICQLDQVPFVALENGLLLG